MNTPIDIEIPPGDYQIGAAAELADIPAVTIRMWEQRHGIVEPRRNEAGRRLYSAEQVARLRLLRRTVAAGHAISTLVDATDEELRQRIATSEAATAVHPVPMTVAMIGRSVPATELLDGALVQLQCADFASFEPAFVKAASVIRGGVEALVIDVREISTDTLRAIAAAQKRLKANTTVVVYHTAHDAHLKLLESDDTITVQAPISTKALLLLCRGMLRGNYSGSSQLVIDPHSASSFPIPARLFTDQELVRCANQATSIQCECPEHLAHLIETINSFEGYSRDCESKNPEDAAIHMMLHAVSAATRRSLEDALATVLRHEGIDLESV